MSRYWNGFRWVDDPPMARAEPSALPFDTSDVREALLEAELNPRTITTEDVPLEVSIEEVPMPEQPTPNLVERSIDIFSRNPVHREDDTPVVGRVTTRDRQEITGLEAFIPNTVTHAELDRIALQPTITRKTSNVQTNECPIWSDLDQCWIESDSQLRARIAEKLGPRNPDTVKATEADKEVFDPSEVKITDEVRERIRRELGMKGDGGSD